MASEAEVRVVTFWASPFGMRAEFALRAKGVAYERVLEVDHWFNKSKLLVDSNPVHKQIPVLLHRGRPIPESLAIIQYVDDAWPSPDGVDLLPKDPYDRAVARFWADFVDKKVYSALAKVLQTTSDAQKLAVQEALEYLSMMENVLATIPKEPPFFGGSKLGLVDMVFGPLTSCFPAYEVIGEFKFNLEEKFPHLHTWVQAIKNSSCGQCFPDEEKLLEFIISIRPFMMSKFTT